MVRKRIISTLSAIALVFSLFTLLPEGALKAEALTKYQLKVAGVQVTSENKSDILGNGEASYNSSTKTLTIQKDITNPDPFILGCVDNEIDGLTIIAKNAVTLTSDEQAIRSVGHNLTIEGGKYTLDAQKCGIYCSNCTVTIEDADIETTSNCKWGISGRKTNDKLIINNSKVKVNENPDCYCAVGEFASEIELLNCFVSSPEGGFPGKYATNNYCILKAKSVRATQVTILPYNISLGNTPLTYENHTDILEDGTSRFDYETKTLYLNNAQAGGRFGFLNSNCSGLTINVEGECGFSAIGGGAGANFRADTTITGSGKIYFTSTRESTSGTGIVIAKGVTLTLDNADVVATGTNTGIKGADGSKLVVNGSALTAVGLSETDGVGIDDVAGGITLNGCKYKAPLGAVITNGTVYNANGRTKAKKVEIAKRFTVTFSGTNAYIDQEPNPYKKLTSGDEVIVGSKVRLIYDSDVSIPTGKYVTGFTSDQVTIQKDGVGYYFIMPDKSVTITPSYGTQQSHVIDLSGGNAVTLTTNESSTIRMLSGEYSDQIAYINNMGYDLDKNGTADFQKTYDSATNTESLVRLSTNSVNGDISFDVKNAPYSPLTFRMSKAAHDITVQNGAAYNIEGNKITAASEGDTVYIKFDKSLTPDDKYIGGGYADVSVKELPAYIYISAGYDYGFKMPSLNVTISPSYHSPSPRTVDVSNGAKLASSDGALLCELAEMGVINYTGDFLYSATFDLDKDGHGDIFFNYYYSVYGNAADTTNLQGEYTVTVPKNFEYSPITFIFDVKKYDLFVAGKQVTSMNYADILGDGVFSYDPTTNILDVNGNCTSILDNTIRNFINGLTVRINKDCTFAESLLLDANTTVTGNGKLTINVRRGHLGFIISGSDHTLTFDNANIVINGGSNSIITENGNTNSLIIINSSISAESNYGFTTNTFKQVTLTDCAMVTPSDGIVKTTGFYNSDGTSSPTKVKIASTKWEKGDVNHDGTVSLLDVVFLSRAVSGVESFKGYLIPENSFDGNDEVSRLDVVLLSRRVSKGTW